MDERDQGALQRVHDALVQRGFQRDWGSENTLYRGVLDQGGLNVPVILDISKLDFVRPPPIYVDDSYLITGRKLPHLLDGLRSFCYYAAGSVILDRYNPGSTVLQCLNQADAVMRDAVRGRSDGDFADEFQTYWADTFLLVDLPAEFTGRAKVRFLQLGKETGKTAALCLDTSWLLDVHRANGLRLPDGDDCVVIKIDDALSLNPNEKWPPASLAEFNQWLGWAAPSVLGTIERAFSSGKSATRWVAIRALNGVYLFRATLPVMLQTDEFQKSRQSNLPNVLKRVAKTILIERISGVPADPDYIYNRNMGTMSNLSGKRILLIGIGTIGSFVAQQLAQLAAGSGGGKLTLVDTDKLRTANLGRHLLGVPFLHRNKAEATAAFLRQQLPMLSIDYHDEDALQHLSRKKVPYDLIIDATGEEALSLAINERAVRNRVSWPPVLFGYLLGNGALSQALMTGDPQYACLKCLKPSLSGVPRFKALRPEVEVVTINNMECADPFHIPYPVTRSTMAASLICEMALSWAGGAHGDRLRSHLFDPSRAYQTKDGSPAPSPDCPACQEI